MRIVWFDDRELDAIPSLQAKTRLRRGILAGRKRQPDAERDTGLRETIASYPSGARATPSRLLLRRT